MENIQEIFTKETSLVAQTVQHVSTMRETWVRSLGWEDPLEKEMWKIHGYMEIKQLSPKQSVSQRINQGSD